MIISSLGGTILNQTIVKYPRVASYQAVINGVAGNLVGVQASRLSTALHQQKKTEKSQSNDSETEFLLLGLVVPGHLTFNFILSFLNKGSDNLLTLLFTILYLSAALIQVGLLLKMASRLVNYLWTKNIDPDN